MFEKKEAQKMIKLLPLLIIYFVIFFVLAKEDIGYGDELRYATYAENLTEGFYAPKDTLYLWNGPGYPLLLAPFAYLNIPWYYAKMLNPVFLFVAVCLFYSCVKRYSYAVLFTYIFGLYPPMLDNSWRLLTEPFTIMLVALFLWFMVRWFHSRKFRFMVLAALICAFINLTKVFFAHVSEAILILSFVFYKKNFTAKKTLPIFGLGLLFCLPYLIYTYSITGKPFYWSTAGGDVLCAMTTPYPEEYGDGEVDKVIMERTEWSRHRDFLVKLQRFNFVERDGIKKKKAVENILINPRKVMLNYACNWSRLFLNFPFSYKYQHPKQLLYILPGGCLLFTLLICFYLIWKFRPILPPEIVFSIMIFAVYVIGHSFVSAIARFLCPMLIFIFLIITYSFDEEKTY